jgi:4a-hydroxytetrahydrobiopterin dehydratase
MSLADKTCEPCRGGVEPMDRDKSEALLKEVPGWELSDDATRISRDFKFENFVEAMDFVRWVGHASESAGHHPEITFGWGKARVTFYTHKIGGLHENDFIMAARTNRLYEEED